MPRPEDETGASGPYLWVALPQVPPNYRVAVPLNVTGLLLEWEAMLEPVRALRNQAARLEEMVDWSVDERFAAPSYLTLQLLRAAATDEVVVESFRTATGRLRFPKTWRKRNVALKNLITPENTLEDRASPMLLGMATVAAVVAELGYASHGVSLRMWEEAERRAAKLSGEVVESEGGDEPDESASDESQGNGEAS